MLFIIIHNSVYNMLFNIPPVSFTLSNILPSVSLCSLSLRSLSPPSNLSALSRSLSARSPGGRAEGDRERKQRDRKGERAERSRGRLENEREREERSGERKLTCAWRRRITAWRRHWREPLWRRTTRGVLILLSIRMRHVFFFLLGAEREDDEWANLGGFFCHRPRKY